MHHHHRHFERETRFEGVEEFLMAHEHMWGRGSRSRGRHGLELGFGRGPGSQERFLGQGDLRWLILDLIATQPRHGYELIKEIEEMFGGNYSPSPGVVYPTLSYLEETGMVAAETENGKRRYSITEEGAAAKEENAASMQALRERIEAIQKRFGGRPAPEIHRAMDNLRSAMKVRLSKGEISPESVAAITAALDRAAAEIERA